MSLKLGNVRLGQTDEGISENSIKLQNSDKISDLILLNNNNDPNNQEYGIYSNLTIRYENSYLTGYINSNYVITSNPHADGIFDTDDYMFSLSCSNIDLKHSNINLDFSYNFNINNLSDSKNIIDINKNNSSINLNNYDIKIKLNDTNNFYVINSIDDITLFDFNSNNASFHCDLIVDNLYTDHIHPTDVSKNIRIENFEIGQNVFNDINIGRINYNTDSTIPNITPLILNNNTNNNELNNNILEIRKFTHDTNNEINLNNYTTIINIDNNGFINIGNCDDIYNEKNKNSYLYINNYDNDYVSSNLYSLSNVDLLFNYKANYEGDYFNINQYGNLTIGTNNSNNSLLFINRNDDRLNLDISNSNNVNMDNPLLKLNINYNTKNNYIWRSVIRNDYYLQKIFTSVYFQGVPSTFDTLLDEENFFNSYKNNYSSNFANLDANLSISLDHEDYPKLYYSNKNHRYYFLHAQQISTIIDYDYTKLNLQLTNSCNLSTEDNNIFNVLYNRLNLKTNENEINYEYKVESWNTAIGNTYNLNHIIYPSHFIYNNLNNSYKKTFELRLLNISTAIKTTQYGISDQEVPQYLYQHFILIPMNLPTEIDASAPINISTDSDVQGEIDQLKNFLARDDIFSHQTSEIKNLINSTSDNYFKNFTCIKHVENGTDIFAIHISRNVYNNFIEFQQQFNNLEYNIIDEPNFFEFSKNNLFTSAFTSDGTLSFNNINELPNTSNNNHGFAHEYSIYSKDKRAIFNKIETDIITTIDNKNDINFDMKNLSNIGQIYFNNNQLFNLENLDVLNITNNKTSNININNSVINFNPTFYGINWKNISILDINSSFASLLVSKATSDFLTNYNYQDISVTTSEVFSNNLGQTIPIDSYIYITINDTRYYLHHNTINNFVYVNEISDINFKNLLINKATANNTLQYNHEDIILNSSDVINSGTNILINSIISININSNTFYFKQNTINSYTKRNHYDNIYTQNNDYHNSIINIDTTKDLSIHPNISICGSNASFSLKTPSNYNLEYFTSIKNYGFKNLAPNVGGENDKKNIFEISYINNFDENFDTHFHELNTRHILQHIPDDYNLITLGENYNICIDNRGPETVKLSDQLFGTKWLNNGTQPKAFIGIELNNQTLHDYLQLNNTLTLEEWQNCSIDNLLLTNYIIVNGYYYYPTSDLHSDLLKNNSSNSTYKVSIGVPHNDTRINNNSYLYNFPRYFKEIVKDSDYMLNIYGSTKIYGIDGDTTAFAVNINDTKSIIDNNYKINTSIGCEILYDNDNNNLKIDGNIYSDKIFYKKIEDNTYVNISNIHNNVLFDITSNIFPTELAKSYIHTSNINNNFINDDGILNINLIPHIPISNLSIPDPPLRDIRVTEYYEPFIDINNTNTSNFISYYQSDYNKKYTIGDSDFYDNTLIDDSDNGYHYYRFTNISTDNTNTNYTLHVKDSILCDVIIVGGGGGGGAIGDNYGTIWSYIGEIKPDGEKIDNAALTNEFLNIGTSHKFFTLAEWNLYNIDLPDDAYIEYAGKFYIPSKGAGGEGGQIIRLQNVSIPANTDVEITIGNGGIGSGSTNDTPTNGINTLFKINDNTSFIAQGGSALYNYHGEGAPGPINIASWTYSTFNISYPGIGQNNSINKYFSGTGGSYQQIGGLGGGGGVDINGLTRGQGQTGDALQNSGGGGGHGSTGWGNGASGIILLRFKYNIKNEFYTHVADINTLTNTYLEYNWVKGEWVLNEYIADTCNIVLTELINTSNDLINNIYNNSNYNDITSNYLYHYTSNLNIHNSNYINIVNSNLLYLHSDTSNYIDNIKTTINNIHSSNITNGELEIERLPLIPFSKFSNLDLSTLYSPKINHNIAEFTSYYTCNIDYTTTDSEYCQYLILEYNDNYQTQQTSYDIEFRFDCKIDILLVGGGGGGGGVQSINSGGGGGGGIIYAKDIDIIAGKSYNMKVGNGGATKSDGFDTEAFGIIAYGGKAGTSDDNPLKGTGGLGGLYKIDALQAKEIVGKIILSQPGGKGGTSDRNSVDNTEVSGIDGTFSDIYYNINDGNTGYYWGGGGGASRWFNNNGDQNVINNPELGIKYGDLPIGGLGGGGAGAIRSTTISLETATGGLGYNIGDSRSANSVNDILASTGGNGGKSTGGGGGGGFDIDGNSTVNGTGGRGGSGIIIIKYYNLNIPAEGDRSKGYLSYNYNSYKWEMNSIDLINLDIDLTSIDTNLIITSNELVNYVQEQFNINGGVVNYTVIPLSFITNNSLVNNVIGPQNIIGYMGKTSNIDDTLTSSDLISKGWVNGVGLINLPPEAYYDQTNMYYPLLIKGEKFANNTITNNNIADNTITYDKLYGQLSGSKIANATIPFSSISGNLTNPVNIIDDSGALIDISLISSANLNINILDFSGDKKIGGITYITQSSDNLIKIPFDRLTDISIDISHIDISTNISGTTKITSSTNSIPLNILTDIELDVINLQNYGNSDFELPPITLLGSINKDYLTTIYVPTSNLDSSSLLHTSVILTGNEKVQPNIIANLNLSAEQIDTSGTTYLQNVTLNFDQSKLDPSVLANIQVRPEDIAFKERSLIVDINTTYIPSGLNWIYFGITEPSYGRKLNDQSYDNIANLISELSPNNYKTTFTLFEWNTFNITDLKHNDYIEIDVSGILHYFIPERGLLNPATLSNIELYPTDLDTFDNNFTWKIANAHIDTSSVKLNPLFLSNIELKPNDLDQQKDGNNNYINKLENVSIDTSSLKLDPALIGDLILTPDQLNTANQLSSVTLSTPIPDQSINPSLINPNSVTINASQLKTGLIDVSKPSLGYHQFSSTQMINFATNSIDPTLIPINTQINGNMLIVSDPTKKIQSPNITGDVDTSIIGDGAIITNTANITSTTGAKINNVNIASTIDVSVINNATITDGNNITTSQGVTKIGGRAYIYGDIPINIIDDATIDIDGVTTTINTSSGSHFSGVSSIFGNINASFINNPAITIDNTTTSLTPGSTFSGNVTLTGTINASHIGSPISLQLVDGASLDGADITNDTITSDKLSNNLTLNVSSITFSDSTVMNSAISSDILTGTEIANLYISKASYQGYFNEPSINNKFNINLYNTSTTSWNVIETPLYMYDSSKMSISTFLPFSSFKDNESILTINSKNNNSKIIIASYYTSDFGTGNIGVKDNYLSSHGGSIISVANSRLSIIVYPNGISNAAYNAMEFSDTANYSHSELHIPKIIFSDGTEMTTAAISLLDANKQLIMNNAISGFNYVDTQPTGEGFIHCNGLHAQFDITAYSTTTQSDERLKKDIKQINYDNELLKLNPVSFKWNDTNKSNTSNVGFIAQEIETIFPELVKNGIDDYKSVNYTGLIPYLVKHIQKLEERIQILEKKNNI